MRLITFNIQYRRRESQSDLRNRCRHLADFIRSLKPDVLAMQEVIPEAWSFLNAELDMTASEYRPREDGDSEGEGVPVCIVNPSVEVTAQTSFWLSDTPEVPSRLPGSVHPRICSAVRFVEAGLPHWLFNLHLDHKNPRVRKRSMEILHSKLTSMVGKEDRVLVCGDFNMPGHHPVIREFSEGVPELTDSCAVYGKKELHPTFLGWGRFRLARARIDLVLHSSGFQVRQYQAVDPLWKDRLISDHRAVVVDLEPKP